MASFWQSKTKTTACDNKKKALQNILSRGVSCTATETKMEEADLLNSQNKLEKAYRIYKDVLGQNPSHVNALFGIGVILEKQKQFDLAIQFLSRAIETDPDKSQALLARGRIFRLQGILGKAIADFTEFISNYPDHFEALIARGIAFGQTSQFNVAIDDFSLAIRINSNCAEAFYNRGVVYEKLYKFEAAIKDYSIAIKLNPHDFKAYNNRGVAKRETRRFDSALKDFDKSVEIKPDFAEGYYNKALTLLSVGSLEEGFKLYEYRWKTAYFQSQLRHFTQPLWLGGENLTGKTILLHSEQGLGDSIQFCRYVKFFETMECHVLLETERPLMSLMRSLLPKECIFEKGSRLPTFDYHCPLMSLPYAFGTKRDTIPNLCPYLSARKDKISYWKQRLGKKEKLRIGISWQGNKDHAKDHKRSILLSDIINEFDDEFEWVSLQYALSNDDTALLNTNKSVRHYGSEIGSFAMTAALCANLDVVVSVDTSVGHLAGALGKKTLLLLSDMPDARWQMQGSRTPWYRSTILVRQRDCFDWAQPIQEAKNIIRFCQ